MVETITIGYGLCALVDSDDYPRVVHHVWSLQPHDATVYARSNIGGKKVSLHRFILGSRTDDLVVDHINGKGYDCRKENLRWVTVRENNRNFHQCEWQHVMRIGKDLWCYVACGHRIGRFVTAFAAALAFDQFVRTMGLDQSQCHFPPPGAVEYSRTFQELPCVGRIG